MAVSKEKLIAQLIAEIEETKLAIAKAKTPGRKELLEILLSAKTRWLAKMEEQ
jgi:preprotein translocase subunit Sss1